MGDLKSALKNVKALLSEGKNQESLDALQEFIDNGEKNYMLFCFAALAQYNLSNFKDSKIFYEKALTLNSELPTAWQGLYKIYEKNSINDDLRGIEVCEMYLKLCTSEDKKQGVFDTMRRINFNIGEYESLLDNLGSDKDLMKKIVEKSAKQMLSTTEKTIISAAFKILADDLETDAEIHAKYCKYLFSTNNEAWKSELERYCTIHDITEKWFNSLLLELLCSSYFVNQTSNWELFDKLDQSLLEKENKEAYTVLGFLRNQNHTAAIEHLDNLPRSVVLQSPLSMIGPRLYSSVEQFEQVILVCEKLLKANDNSASEVKNVAAWLAISSYISIEKEKEAVKLWKDVQPTVLREFAVERAAVGNFSNENNDSWISELNPTQKIRAQVAKLCYAGSFAEGAVLADQLMASDDSLPSDVVLAATCRFEAKMDSTQILVKAAKLNPYSSRVFYMLGAVLANKNTLKARSLLDRAVKIRPTSERYVMELENVLSKLNAPVSERISLLSKIATAGCSPWIRERLSRLYISDQSYENALVHLQAMVRENVDHLWGWAQLAECYCLSGRLQASISAYQECLRIRPKSDFVVPLLQLYLRLGRNDDVLSVYEEFEGASVKPQTRHYLDLAKAQCQFRMALCSSGEDKRSLLKGVVHLVAPIIESSGTFERAYKLAADALIEIARFSDRFLSDFNFPAKWNCSSTAGCLRCAVSFYSFTLCLNKKNVLAWIDIAQALLFAASVESSKLFAQKAIDCLRKALRLNTPSRVRSKLWTLLGEAYRLADASIEKQAHCLIRSLQLNKTNDVGWLRLGLLYLTYGEVDLAFKAFETSLLHNPKSAEAWCAWAWQAEVNNVHTEAEEMYKQSLTWKPLTLAASKFVGYLCEGLRTNRKFDPSIIKIDINKINGLFDNRHISQKDTLHLAVLSELFGGYSSAVQFLGTVEAAGIHLSRAKLKCGISTNVSEPALIKLSSLVNMDTEALIQELKNHLPIYQEIIGGLETNDNERVAEALNSRGRDINMPLIVSAIIVKTLSLEESLVYKLHAIRPRHELIDVFPTEVPTYILNEMDYQEKDGEEPFRSTHLIAQDLCDILRELRNSFQESQPVEVPN